MKPFENAFVYQRDAMDCGPSCLAMIASYYGKKLNIEQLREKCYLAKDGVSLLGISKAAEKKGFHTVGGKLTFTVLYEKNLLPCIAHWDQNHFVVIYKIKKKKRKDFILYIADPGKGLLTYSKQEFLEHWASTSTNGEEKGVVLLLEPTELFFNEKDDIEIKKNRLSFLWKYTKKYRYYFLQIIVGLIIGSIIQLIFPFLTQIIVDTGIKGQDINFILLVLIAQLMLLFSRTAVDFIRNKILLHISTRINISLVSDFFIKLMKLPMSFFDTKLMGDLLQRIEDHRRVELFLTSSSLNLLFSFFSFIIFGIVLFMYNILIFSIFLCGSVVYGGWITFFLKKRRQLDNKYFEQAGKNRNVTYQLINGMQEIKLQGCEQRKRWEWEDVQVEMFEINLKSLNLQQTQQVGSIIINELKNILITAMAAASVINGEMTLGMMLAIQYIIGQLNSPIEQLVNFIYSWQDVSISLDRINEIHTEGNEENQNRTIKAFNSDNAIELSDVYFKYDASKLKYVLNNINLVIPKGKITAIVGASGSGKTTLIKLLLGYYSPQKGKITVGNINLEQIDLVWWRRNCGTVMQEGYLFSDTIARNISVSDDEPNLDKIRNAATMTNIADYIENLPLGYNTMIGQDGQGISQGQRQRILIARVIYKNPHFVFLDEATNALDASNEEYILKNLKTFYTGKTAIIVAHRLSTVKDADQIIVLDNGQIIEVGIHKELVSMRGKYYELVRNQLELGN